MKVKTGGKKKTSQEEQLSKPDFNCQQKSFLVRSSPGWRGWFGYWKCAVKPLRDSACRDGVKCKETQPSVWHMRAGTHTHAHAHTYTCSHTHLLHSLHGWWWILVAAEVNNDPGNITEEGDGDWWIDERKQGLDHTQRDDIIPALWPITWLCKGAEVNRTLDGCFQAVLK